ncbi:hypothetical protein GGS24DRAFT_470021 [Hypoxylon argillaceum]|nr:hypothetical protein GGS24DRAFT_470021 [Hypoxylon argillaceum]
MDTILVLGDEENRTYTMDALVRPGLLKGTLKNVIWHKIPCAPSNVNTLVIKVHIESGSGYHIIPISTTHRGAPVIRKLYQIIERCLQHGLVLSRTSPLLVPFHFKNLYLHFSEPDQEGSTHFTYSILPGTGQGSISDYAAFVIGGIFGLLQSTGMLYGSVDRVHMTMKGVRDQFTVVPSMS